MAEYPEVIPEEIVRTIGPDEANTCNKIVI